MRKGGGGKGKGWCTLDPGSASIKVTLKSSFSSSGRKCDLIVCEKPAIWEH